MSRIGLLLLAAILVGCDARPPATPTGSDPVRVVTTTSVFADLVRQVGGSHVAVDTLVPKNGDVHTFAPKPADIRAVADAQLLVMNGVGLDDWLLKTMRNAARPTTPVLRLAEDLPGAALLPGDEPATRNPHLWLDVRYAQGYVERIRVALGKVDPAHAADYDAQASRYDARLAELDRWVRQQVASVPESNRRIVTFHDAFAYYAREYGLTVVGVAVPAPGQDPSAGYTAALVQAIRANGVKAIFSERQFPARLVTQLAAETGAVVVADLYDDSVGDPPVTSYEALIRWDTERISEALR